MNERPTPLSRKDREQGQEKNTTAGNSVSFLYKSPGDRRKTQTEFSYLSVFNGFFKIGTLPAL
jgi:hypothetical protein